MTPLNRTPSSSRFSLMSINFMYRVYLLTSNPVCCRDFVHAKCIENYSLHYTDRFYRVHRPAGRPTMRLSGIYGAQKQEGANFQLRCGAAFSFLMGSSVTDSRSTKEHACICLIIPNLTTMTGLVRGVGCRKSYSAVVDRTVNSHLISFYLVDYFPSLHLCLPSVVVLVF